MDDTRAGAFRKQLLEQARAGTVVIYPASEVPAELSVRVTENKGDDNWVVVDAALARRAAPIDARFYGSGNTLHLGANAVLGAVMRFHGSNGITHYEGAGQGPCVFQVTHWSNDTEVRIGAGSTSNGTQLIAMGDGARITIGPDCMFAADTWVMTSDMHCIVDSRTGEVLNKHGNVGNVDIERHVWVGQESMVLHGVRVGRGSIIGAKSLVKSDVPAESLVAGTPAKVLRGDATWLRNHAFTPHEFARVRAALDE